MERSRKLTLTDWTKANDALNSHFEGNKSKLTKHLNMSRTTVTAFFSAKPVREAEFRKICLALRLNWQEVSKTREVVPKQEDWIEEVRSRCCQKILYQHGTIQLLSGAEIGVDQLYVDVWLLNRSPRTFQVSESKLLESFDLRNDRLGLGDRIKRNEGMEVANSNPRLLILGKPGAGKTTFLKHLAVDCCNSKFQPNLIPVLIELRKIRSTEWKILDAIAGELGLNNLQTETLLEQGKLLVLMDGLDEVSTNSFRRDVQNQICEIVQESKHLDNRFILTCRTQIIDVIPRGFISVEVADFNDEQVKKFVENWFHVSGQSEIEIAQQWQTFLKATRKNPALNELTVTPVLLSLMCLVMQDAGELPSQAALLYRKGIRLLLEKWNDRKEIHKWEIGEKVYRKLEPDRKEALLIEIAARKFENPGNFVLFEQADLVQQIVRFLRLSKKQDGEAVLRALEAQHGLLVERADELWSFSHLTFQEYFTVQWLMRLSPDQLAKKITNHKWQEVVRQLIKSQPASRLLKLIKQAIDYSISQDERLQDCLAWIHEKSESVNTTCKRAGIRAFYFALIRDLASELPLSRILAVAGDLSLVDALDLARNLDLNLASAFAYNSRLDLDLNLDLDLARTINDVFARATTSRYAGNYAIDDALTYALETGNDILALELQRLRAQLPKSSSTEALQDFRYWSGERQAWAEQLRQVAITYRNIGHDWQFTSSQREALKQYHDINNFLVQLIRQSDTINTQIRQEIEDNLLLPIAELKRRSPDQYS